MDEMKLISTDQRIQAWYNVYNLCLSLGMDVTDKTGEQAVLDFIARIQELETAGRPFAHPDLCKRLPNNGASSDEQAVIFVRNNAVITLADCKRIAALLNNPPLEKE